MPNIKINGFIDKTITDNNNILAAAIIEVNNIDTSANKINYLYYFSTLTGEITLVINDIGKDIYKFSSNQISTNQIGTYLKYINSLEYIDIDNINTNAIKDLVLEPLYSVEVLDNINPNEVILTRTFGDLTVSITDKLRFELLYSHTMRASNETLNNRYGCSVSTNGNKILIGCEKDNNSSLTDNGCAFLYDIDGTNEVKIIPSNAKSYCNFGNAVIINDNYILIASSYFDTDGKSSCGIVYRYDLDGTNELIIKSSNGLANDRFGYSIAMTDNKILVGAMNKGTGVAYLYDIDGTNEVKIYAPMGRGQFGYSVAMNDTRIVIGAPDGDHDYYGNINYGGAVVYDLAGNIIKIIAGEFTSATTGHSVDINDINIVVGSRTDRKVGLYWSGWDDSVSLYDLDGNNRQIVPKLTPAGVTYTNGSKVFITKYPSNNYLFIGNYLWSGFIYRYDIDTGESIIMEPKSAVGLSNFGFTVAIVNRNNIIVGAPYGTERSGAVPTAGFVDIFN